MAPPHVLYACLLPNQFTWVLGPQTHRRTQPLFTRELVLLETLCQPAEWWPCLFLKTDLSPPRERGEFGEVTTKSGGGEQEKHAPHPGQG